ncbi:hypothetical protein DMN91_011295 [Ooceraea biroi]|uniref:Synaptosomal-associated protein n=1 Tax=Ooceraea biroi TaxID=2015173 RepID=A0A026WX02_OOCBI|nr:uncharacterized protein LOC105274513 [Ooceraea biroi]EZA60368.1 hypothetical protein X777_13457 [Ooceraea biroi]RLU17226.1 hypothetical protein DMN91_011295 [Ooceraea biroi]
MDSQDYQHVCERAELLGLPKPTEEEWRQTQAAQSENRCDDDDNSILQDLDYADETTGRIGGGLDELNSILSTTQKKLNRFKTVCGSLGSLLKGKVSSRGGTPRHKPEESNLNEKQQAQVELGPATDEVMTVETSDNTVTDDAKNPTDDDAANSDVKVKQSDLSQKMGSHLDKLDSLISKAENAQYSMQHQSKQMRKFLKK